MKRHYVLAKQTQDHLRVRDVENEMCVRLRYVKMNRVQIEMVYVSSAQSERTRGTRCEWEFQCLRLSVCACNYERSDYDGKKNCEGECEYAQRSHEPVDG